MQVDEDGVVAEKMMTVMHDDHELPRFPANLRFAMSWWSVETLATSEGKLLCFCILL